MTPGAGRVSLAPRDGSSRPVEMWVDGPIAPVESGYGGWSVVAQEGQVGTVEYTGVEPKRWVLPILLDGWADSVDVQGDWDGIESLCEPDGVNPPPEVLVAGASIFPKLTSHPWVIEKLTPGEEWLTDGSGRLLRGKALITLLQPNQGNPVVSPIKQARSAGSKSKSSRTIRARKGDDLVIIAARELGDPIKWRDISNLNGGLQPDNVKVGQKIKLP